MRYLAMTAALLGCFASSTSWACYRHTFQSCAQEPSTPRAVVLDTKTGATYLADAPPPRGAQKSGESSDSSAVNGWAPVIASN